MNVRAAPEGSLSLDAPAGKKQWDATFGYRVLCRTGDDVPVLDDVLYQYAARPLETVTSVRHVDIDDPRAEITGARVLSLEDVRGGEVNRDVSGVRVEMRCPDDGLSEDFSELLTTMTVGPQGGAIESSEIAYHVGEEKYRLRVDWAFAACGVEIPGCGRPKVR